MCSRTGRIGRYSLVTPCLLEVTGHWGRTDNVLTLTGDSTGCGRFFEGTPAEMHKALNVTLAGLPEDTKVYVSVVDQRQWSVQMIDRKSPGMSTPRRM